MRVKIFMIVFLILLSINVLADNGPLFISDYSCKKDGSLKLTFIHYAANKIYAGDIKIKAEYIGEVIIKKPKFDVVGKWSSEFIEDTVSAEDRTTLLTGEVIFNLSGEYMLTLDYLYNKPYTLQYKIKCPGFEFSCKLLNVYVDYCRNINNERFEAAARIYGLGKVTKENLSLDKNVEFMLQADKDYEDVKGKSSIRGGLPQSVKIYNPEYGRYYFNLSWNNKIKSFVAKIVGINYIAGGCANYPNISLYSFKECEDVEIKEKKAVSENKSEENNSKYTGYSIKEQEIIKELEKDIGTKEEDGKWRWVILFVIFGLCVIGITYIVIKRNFNKETGL